ncbi:DUF4974 domain-containing protein [Niastella caeni]|uniref:DUF4974 domain-containing protein n=1 Tax=Niastella caeni TaxID=2569763 RepID=A0A4S8HSY2_9BACT|nr:FecR domain-containing protein [Niastella caeni]THU38395.1 DUF4974 domain-containing protein [Niastella caeni]
MAQNRINYLLEKKLAQQATPAELEEFDALVQNANEDSALREALAAAWLQFTTTDQLPQPEADVMFNNILTTSEGLHRQPAKVVPLVRGMNWRRMVAAAVIIILLGAGTILYLNNNSKSKSTDTSAPVIADIKAPGSANAILTLSNGQQIELNKTATGNVAQQENANIMKLANGQIVYNASSANNAPLTYNTLTVPRGSQVVSIVLADGSKVWLNAASSLRYPVAFTGNERNIEMTGEVYFEVAKNAGKPFIVIVTQGARVEVLGTHFNINAYNDEESIKTTLLEGKVKVSDLPAGSQSQQSAILKPGEQAAIYHSPLNIQHSPLTINHSPDLEEVMAWKNGRFEFAGNTIEPIMQQVARWYNVQIEYRGAKPTDNFMGGTSRQANVSEILKILEQTKAVRFHIEDKKIIVSKP